MPVRIRHNFKDIIARVKVARSKLPKVREKALQEVGERLLEHAREDYVVKSAGGSDKAGGKWKPLAESTIEQKRKKGQSTLIGVATGEQAATLDFKVMGNRVDVGATTDHAPHFDEVRPIFSEESLFAPERLTKVEDLLVKQMEKAAKGITK